jgi:hypothetical protein
VVGRRAARRRPGSLVLLRRDALDRVVLRTGSRLAAPDRLIRCPDGVRVAERSV